MSDTTTTWVPERPGEALLEALVALHAHRGANPEHRRSLSTRPPDGRADRDERPSSSTCSARPPWPGDPPCAECRSGWDRPGCSPSGAPRRRRVPQRRPPPASTTAARRGWPPPRPGPRWTASFTSCSTTSRPTWGRRHRGQPRLSPHRWSCWSGGKRYRHTAGERGRGERAPYVPGSRGGGTVEWARPTRHRVSRWDSQMGTHR